MTKAIFVHFFDGVGHHCIEQYDTSITANLRCMALRNWCGIMAWVEFGE